MRLGQPAKVFFRRFGIEQMDIPAVAPDIGWLAKFDRPFTFVAVAEFLAFWVPLVRPRDTMLDRQAIFPSYPSDGDAGYDKLSSSARMGSLRRRRET